MGKFSSTDQMLKGKNGVTVWKTKPMVTTATKTSKENLVNLRVNTLGLAADAKEPVECLRAFFTDSLMDIVVKYTNERWKKMQFSEENKNKPPFKPRVVEELEAFTALLVLSGATKNNHDPIKRLYDRTISGDRFQATLPHNRFVFISRNRRYPDARRKTNGRQIRFSF